MSLKKMLFALVCLSVTLMGLVPTEALAARIPLYRYFNPTLTKHFYTTVWNELGTNSGYAYEATEGYVENTHLTGLTPLYRYYNTVTKNYYLTVNWSELGSGRDGWTYQGVLAYVSPNDQGSCGCSTPMYVAYWAHPVNNHFFTSNWQEWQNAINQGYKNGSGIAFYLYKNQ